MNLQAGCKNGAPLLSRLIGALSAAGNSGILIEFMNGDM